MAEEEDEQDDERYASTASSWVSTSYSAARRARTGRSPRRDVAVGHAEAVLEAWAKRMDLAPVTLGDGYTGRGERNETKNLVVAWRVSHHGSTLSTHRVNEFRL